MARPNTVPRRVQRIRAERVVPPGIRRRHRLLITAALVPLAVLSAGTVTRSALPTPDLSREPGLARLDRYVGRFQVGVISVLTVTRDGGRLVAQLTGEPPLRLVARGDAEFVTELGNEDITFLTNGAGAATEVALRGPNAQMTHGVRIDAVTAGTIEARAQRRTAATPDRFKDQVPMPGGGDALRRMIEALRRGVAGDQPMSPQLADKLRGLTPLLHDAMAAFGATESIAFRGVGPGGYDIYDIKFAGGSAEFRIALAADGTIEDVIFHPDGNGAPGGIVTCAQESTLRSSPGAAAIKVSLVNRSGADIRLFWLDAAGRRLSRGILANDGSMDMLTDIARPLVIADPAGQCREIVLPGRTTRVHVVEPLSSAGSFPPRRDTPLAGGAVALQRYIDGVRRGAPDYDRMTSAAAAATRQLLPRQQAILAKLGPWRALSFRGVTPAGSDVYMVQFANGSVEWQIGLTAEDRIRSVALGPPNQ